MKKTLLTLATVITTTATGTSFYLAALPNPTDTQKQLSSTTNTIVIAGATAIFGLLDDDDEDSKNA
jgi:ABC-type phosphate transport system substrate-binding protein